MVWLLSFLLFLWLLVKFEVNFVGQILCFLGYVWIGGEWWNEMEWNGMEWSGMESHSIVWFCKKGMEWNGV